MNTITWLLTHWRLALALTSLAIGGGTVGFLSWQVHHLRDQIAIIAADLKDERAKVAARDTAISAQEKKIHDDQERHAAESAITTPIARAKGTPADGPLAPVARDGLKRLRERQAAAGHS